MTVCEIKCMWASIYFVLLCSRKAGEWNPFVKWSSSRKQASGGRKLNLLRENQILLWFRDEILSCVTCRWGERFMSNFAYKWKVLEITFSLKKVWEGRVRRWQCRNCLLGCWLVVQGFPWHPIHNSKLNWKCCYWETSYAPRDHNEHKIRSKLASCFSKFVSRPFSSLQALRGCEYNETKSYTKDSFF